MAHSLELRTPLVDVRLLEALAPLLSQFAGGAGKLLLASSPERPLGAGITGHRKTGFGVPMGVWWPDPAAPAAVFTPARAPWARRWARYVASRWLP
jgi:asparagine synthase (glutamine-hydrolysing)